MAQRLHQITAQGLEELRKEKEHILTVEIEANKAAIQEARALGDLSENAEYSAAKEIQSQLNNRLAEIEDILKNHEIIAEEWYTIRYDELGVQKSIQLVGVLEADPEENKISKESPIGKAIQGCKVGETVYFTSGSGKKISVTIVEKGKIK
ncbi:GreA/GreB family elongation factor [bacterium]|nr:GreA/GreB family elongation factor [bacterium]